MTATRSGRRGFRSSAPSPVMAGTGAIEAARADARWLIAHARRRWTPRRMFGANCGAFAYALANRLTEAGHREQRIALFYGRGDAAALTATEIRKRGAIVHHVAVAIGDRFYDGDGEVSRRHIVAVTCVGHHDPDPGVLIAAVDDRRVRSCVENGTAWDMPPWRFLKGLRSVALAGPPPADAPIDFVDAPMVEA